MAKTSDECWIVNPGCGIEPRKCDPCPAYKAKISCWKFNWKPIAEKCNYDERQYWREFMIKQCIEQKCPIFLQHKNEIYDKIDLFKASKE